MTKQPEVRLEQLLQWYLGLESQEITEELLERCGASIDLHALPVLKRRLHEEQAQVIRLGARGYIRMREKSEQLVMSLTPLIAALEEEASHDTPGETQY
jgi:hypothetical protein